MRTCGPLNSHHQAAIALRILAGKGLCRCTTTEPLSDTMTTMRTMPGLHPYYTTDRGSVQHLDWEITETHPWGAHWLTAGCLWAILRGYPAWKEGIVDPHPSGTAEREPSPSMTTFFTIWTASLVGKSSIRYCINNRSKEINWIEKSLVLIVTNISKRVLKCINAKVMVLGLPWTLNQIYLRF